MGAVDYANYMCTNYSFSRKSVSWSRKILFWHLELSVVNSFILYNISPSGRKQLSHLLFLVVGDVRIPTKQKRQPEVNNSLLALDATSGIKMGCECHNIKQSQLFFGTFYY